MPDYCGTFEAARLMGLSVGTVQTMVERGELDAWKTQGGHRRISMASIERHLTRQGKSLDELRHDDGGLRILVVEDDPATMAVMKAAFDKWDLPIQVTYIPSAVKALLDIGHLRPHLLLTDLSMPGVDGFDLLRTLDENPAFTSMITVAITGLSEDEIVEKGGLPPRVVVYPKPVSLHWLNGFVTALTAERLASAAAANVANAASAAGAASMRAPLQDI